MLSDLIQSIYTRIAQLGSSIQSLKKSLDDLNKNIEEKITNLTSKVGEFSKEIEITQTKHISVVSEIGAGVGRELKKLQEGIGLEALSNLISKLEQFSTLSGEILNQENVNMLLSEAINSVKLMKESINKEETLKTEEG
jgi:hypothetical protein